jgi:DNA primase large subunit
MGFVPSVKELSHFPFLRSSQELIASRFSSLEKLVANPKFDELAGHAADRIQAAVSGRKEQGTDLPFLVITPPEDEIAVYALARVLVSCIGDRQLIDRLTRYEAERAYAFLVREEEWNRNYEPVEGDFSRLCIAVADEIGLRVSNNRIPVLDYIEIIAQLHNDTFKLVNRKVEHGSVAIRQEERYELIRERIRVIMRRDLPHKVPDSVCRRMLPATERIKKVYQERLMEQFGAVEESAFPPCMQALVSALTGGANLTHAGRFALTSFIHTIGMHLAAIAEMYARSPDYDPEKTMYQVEHITGRGGTGTEYTAPACAAMRTTGLCVNMDEICEKVNHPLSYYRFRKKAGMKEAASRHLKNQHTGKE